VFVETKVKISVPVVVVGVYDEPLGCLTDVGKVTVPEPVVDTLITLVCPA